MRATPRARYVFLTGCCCVWRPRQRDHGNTSHLAWRVLNYHAALLRPRALSIAITEASDTHQISAFLELDAEGWIFGLEIRTRAGLITAIFPCIYVRTYYAHPRAHYVFLTQFTSKYCAWQLASSWLLWKALLQSSSAADAR